MLAATPSLADMVIKLRNGQVITVPVQPGDIESLNFTGSRAAPSGTAAPIALPTATAAVAAAPVSAAGGGTHPPAGALVLPPMKPDHPSGRVLHVGPSRELKTPSQAAHKAKNGDVIEIDAGDYRGDVAVWNQSDIVIENSEFAHNGTTSGSTHGIYIGQVRNFVLRGSYFHDTVTGHHVKTRALNNYILYNRIMDFPESTASYSIDVSNGGRTYIIGNIIEKGPRAENYAMIAYSMEGPTNPLQELYVVGNTMVMDRNSGLFIRSRSPNAAFVADNIMTGPGMLITGAGVFVNNVLAAGAHGEPDELTAHGSRDNRVVGNVGFVDAAHYDYRLKPGSPAIGAGADPGSAAGFNLRPTYMPLTPFGIAARATTGPLDAGAIPSQP